MLLFLRATCVTPRRTDSVLTYGRKKDEGIIGGGWGMDGAVVHSQAVPVAVVVAGWITP